MGRTNHNIGFCTLFLKEFGVTDAAVDETNFGVFGGDESTFAGITNDGCEFVFWVGLFKGKENISSDVTSYTGTIGEKVS